MANLEGLARALDYVNRLGLAPNGNVAYAQECMCEIVTRLEQASSPVFDEQYPISCVFHTHKEAHTGMYFPAMGYFTVKCKDGTKREVSALAR